MKLNFIYRKADDIKSWKRYNNFIEKHGNVWGIKKEIKPIIKIKKAIFEINVIEIVNKYKKIFGFEIKNIKGRLVTTPFSMINDEKGQSVDTIYYSIYTPYPSIVLAHELFHIYFYHFGGYKIKNYEEAKEYFTVILNDIFNKEISKGYPKHQKIREKVFKVWQKTHSIDECIKAVEG
mgnify:CR=1 FL=1